MLDDTHYHKHIAALQSLAEQAIRQSENFFGEICALRKEIAALHEERAAYMGAAQHADSDSFSEMSMEAYTDVIQ